MIEYQIYKLTCTKTSKSPNSTNLQDVKLIPNIYHLFGYTVTETFIDIQDIDLYNHDLYFKIQILLRQLLIPPLTHPFLFIRHTSIFCRYYKDGYWDFLHTIINFRIVILELIIIQNTCYYPNIISFQIKFCKMSIKIPITIPILIIFTG